MGQPDFMETYDPKDSRMKDCWLFGDVFYPDGTPYIVEGRQMNLKYDTKDIPPSKFIDGLGRFDGARIIKWPYQNDGSLTNYLVSMDNDFFLMRYSDVVLMYAEALVRQSKSASGIDDLKTIRKRAGLESVPFNVNNLEELLLERKHELAMEGWTRQDLIRFGKYTRAWWAKDADDDHVLLLPIPSEVLGSNPNLKQNQGYN